MKKINKILNKSNRKKLIKNKEIKKKIKIILIVLNKYNISYKVNSDIDYYKLCIFYNSLIQKQKLENIYDETRSNNLDMWNLLDNKEKNMLVLKERETNNFKLKGFIYNDKPITITFFDELFNALYYNEPSILELKQFNILYKDFKNNIIDNNYYGFNPYINGFIDEEIIYKEEDYICIYNNLINKIQIIFKDLSIKELPLNKDLKEFVLDKELLLAYINNDSTLFLELSKNSVVLSDKTKKKLSKVKQ